MPRGIIPAIAKRLGISKQGVYQRLKRNDEYTIDLLEQLLQNYLKEQSERNQRAQLKKQFIREQIKRFNGLP